jgi:putative two-component system response regulator
MTHLLIVDHEDEVRSSLRFVLERGGHSVREAASVAEARDRLEAETFDLVLYEVNMAGDSGLELVRQLAAELPDTVVVTVTSVDDPVLAEEAMAMGAYGYLVKPIGSNEALISVDSALRRRDLERAHRSHLDELESKVLSRTTALRQALQQLEQAQTRSQLAGRETAERLVAALTLRSEETGGHIERMSRYGAALAARAGLDAWSDDEFRVAAMLHDVGKIGVPDAILLKPGPLSENEFAAIRRHCHLGVSLIGESRSRVLGLGARIALTHHERWDGTGYPASLAGEAIPIEGRVTAIADVFDALTSDRVYRAAVAPDQAMSMMRAERARQFDPAMLDLFEADLAGMVAIRDAYPDPEPGPQIRVVIGDARPLFTDALARALAATTGIAVVGTAGSGEAAESLVAERPTDVVVIEADLTDRRGVGVARRILAAHPQVAVILLAARDDDAMLLAALDAGCAGVVLRDRAFDDLAAAIGAAHRGEPVISSARLGVLLNYRTAQIHAGLTRRETTVLALMADGLSNEAIAQRLVVTLNTVRNHVQRILTKLSSHSKLEAVVEAARRGLLPPRT